MSLLDSPRRLGRYRIVRRLAVGGMAEVYLAIAEGPGGFAKRVVLKRLLPQHERNAELRSMFLDEARLLATLRHPNIAEVYDITEEDSELFFAAEHIDGSDLRDLLDTLGGEPLPLEHAVTIGVGVARALHHAHEQRDAGGRPLEVVHRDVSPANVLVSRAGEVKLVDFGVAKWAAQRSQTRHGVVKGKFAYMSPEQCRAERLDRRSDVFALGVLLYELSTGARPFDGESDYEILSAVVGATPAQPSARKPHYPAALEELIGRCLARAPEARPPTAAAVERELLAFAAQARLGGDAAALGAYVDAMLGPEPVQGEEHALPTSPPVERTMTEAAREPVGPVNPARRRWALGAIAGGLLLVAAAASAWVGARPKTTPAPVSSAAVAPPVPAAPAPMPSAAPPAAGPEIPAPAAAAPERPARRRASPKPRDPPEPPRTVKVWDPDSPMPP